MDPEVRKRALRMIPYGLQVLTARHGEEMTASTVTWISQASFEPPLIMAAIRDCCFETQAGIMAAESGRALRFFRHFR